MSWKRRGLEIGAFVLVAMSCSLGSAIDEAIAKIDRQMSLIRAESGDWRSHLAELQQELPEEARQVIGNELQVLIGRSTQAVAIEARCTVDFTKDRALQGLARLKEELLGRSPDPLSPRFCTTDRPSVSLSDDPRRWQEVVLAGYDLDAKDSSGRGLEYVLETEGGQTMPLPASRVGRTTHYQHTVGLAGLAPQLHRQRVRKIFARFDGNRQGCDGDCPEILVLPWESRKTTARTRKATTVHVPPRARHPGKSMGDREFNTKSDRPMGVEVRTEIRRVQNRIEGRVFLDARENRSDWTRAAGWSEWTQLYSAPPGRQITQFQAPAPFRTTLRISRHGPHNCSSGGVVALCTVWGDRGGSEAGSWTRVQIDWAEFAVQVRETQPAWL